ncbi:EpsG family protein [Aeromonas caviae]|uniref:EpsG family protein n=1 Tax=Aeromonas TaxID=642 RepID=UPI002AB3A95A|nr:EpsG family protein [Aeromonas caviae]MDY7829119.1 EpsG family protein [Aeromonas caviae]
MIIKKSFAVSILMTLPFIILVGMRGGTPDTQIYYRLFLDINSYPLFSPSDFYMLSGVEIGFGWYAYVLSLISDSSFVLFSLFSFLNFIFIYKTTKLTHVKYHLIFLFYISSSYFFMQQFMQMRQGLAISIAFFAISHYIVFKRVTYLFALMLCASCFHQSAFILFLFSLVFFIFNSSSLFKGKKVVFLCSLMMIFLIVVFKFILLDMLIGMSSRLQSYAASEKFSDPVGILTLPVIRTVGIFVFVLIMSPMKLWNDNLFRFMFFMQSVAISTRIGFSDFGILSGRLSTAFSYAEVFMLPMVIASRFSSGVATFICIAVFVLQLVISIGFQSPYLVDMYFIPLGR